MTTARCSVRSTGFAWGRWKVRSRLASSDRIGSIEAGKDADLIAVDPAFVASVTVHDDKDPEELMSRLIFRAHPDMVRAAWVRGRALDGPATRA